MKRIIPLFLLWVLFFSTVWAQDLALPPLRFPDVPKDHPAYEALHELVDAEIIEDSATRPFEGLRIVTKYDLVDSVAKIVEKIEMGEVAELPVASSAFEYPDVPETHPAYRSIQKLIALGLLWGGADRRFDGDRWIDKYEMADFFIRPIAEILSPQIELKPADPALGYRDVPVNHYAYASIQKLIWLGVLPGGMDKSFNGDEIVIRYDLAIFMVETLRAIYEKIKVVEKPPEKIRLPFRFYSLTSGNYSRLTKAGAGGEDLVDLSGSQYLSLDLDPMVSPELFAHTTFSAAYVFGEATAPGNVRSVWVAYQPRPYFLQIGRQFFYQTYSPFSANIGAYTTVDTGRLNYETDLGNISTQIGRFAYPVAETPSNFGSLAFSSGYETAKYTLAYYLITDILGLNTGQASILYGGIKVNPLKGFELAAEYAYANYSSASSTTEPDAYLISATYFIRELELSLGYKRVGEDFYTGPLTDPGGIFGSGQNTRSFLFKIYLYPSEDMSLGGLAELTESSTGQALFYGAKLTGSYRFSKNVILNGSLQGKIDLTPMKQDNYLGSVGVGVRF